MYNQVTFNALNTPSNACIKLVVTLGDNLVSEELNEAIYNAESVLHSWGIYSSNFQAVEVADDDGDVFQV